MEIEGHIGARVVVVVEPEGFAVPFENWEAFQDACFRLPYVTEVEGPQINGAWAITFKDIPRTISDDTIIRWSKDALRKYLKEKYPLTTIVTNLATGEEKIYTLPPEKALVEPTDAELMAAFSVVSLATPLTDAATFAYVQLFQSVFDDIPPDLAEVMDKITNGLDMAKGKSIRHEASVLIDGLKRQLYTDRETPQEAERDHQS